MGQDRVALGLLRRRQILIPTWRGWIVLVALAALILSFAARRAYPFLAVTDPIPRGILVVEGWSADYALEEALQEFNRHPYDKVFVTGGPLESGAPLSEYRTF